MKNFLSNGISSDFIAIYPGVDPNSTVLLGALSNHPKSYYKKLLWIWSLTVDDTPLIQLSCKLFVDGCRHRVILGVLQLPRDSCNDLTSESYNFC